MDTGDEQDGTSRPRWAVPVVATTTALAAVITAVLLLPLPDEGRRPAVLGLFCVLLVVQAVAGVALWRRGRRGHHPLAPRALRVTSAGGATWGLMAGFFYAVPHPGEQSVFSSAVSGAGIGLFLAAVLWLAEPAEHTTQYEHTPTSNDTNLS